MNIPGRQDINYDDLPSDITEYTEDDYLDDEELDNPDFEDDDIAYNEE